MASNEWQALVESAQDGTLMTSACKRQPMRLHHKSAPLHERHLTRDIRQIPSGVSAIIAELVEGLADWPFLLWGDVGTGKTCAGLVLCDVGLGSYFTIRTLTDRLEQAREGKLSW
jgi:hypothetical protein